jgi:hypothetical protein
MKLLQCPTTKFIILLWPTYFMPDNPQCTFSPTALRHYLHYTITTVHLDSLMITTSTGVNLQFPSLKDHSANQLLDYHNFIVVCPKATKPVNLHQPIVNSATSESPLTRVLVHQRLGHNCDEVLDIISTKKMPMYYLCHYQNCSSTTSKNYFCCPNKMRSAFTCGFFFLEYCIH